MKQALVKPVRFLCVYRSYCAKDWECKNGGYCVDLHHCACPAHYTGQTNALDYQPLLGNTSPRFCPRTLLFSERGEERARESGGNRA